MAAFLIRQTIMGLLGAVALLGVSTAAHAEPDAVHGKKLFLYCAACHTVDEDGADKVGPNLFGVVGSRAGTRGDFAYSSELKASGITWTPDKLDLWLKKPTSLVPLTKMAFVGLPKEQDRADMIAYLTQAK